MKHSEQINELSKALSGFQSEVVDADKDKKGYGYNYADLSQILSIIRPLLGKHGLSFMQHASNLDDKIVVETIVMHSSGQWISSELAMQLAQGKGMNSAQAVGSVITYGRRYALTAMFGITQHDDDASQKLEVGKPKLEAVKQKQELNETVTYIYNNLVLFQADNDVSNAFHYIKDMNDLDKKMLARHASEKNPRLLAWVKEISANPPKDRQIKGAEYLGV